MNITIRQIEFKSTNGETNLVGWMYIPVEQLPRGVIQICHGMTEHMGRYHEFMRFLAQNGYAACGIDQLGHGRSATSEQSGYFTTPDAWKRLIEDQYKFNKIIKNELPDQWCVLLGHNMGSFIARLYGVMYPQTINGLILLGTAKNSLKVNMALHLAKISVKKHGASYQDHELSDLIFSRYNEQIPYVKSKFDWLSRDSESVEQYINDPKCGFVFTSSDFCDFFYLLKASNQSKCFESLPKNIPVLILSGTMDPFGEYGKGASWVYGRYLKAGISDVELILYEGARHELLREINATEVFEEIQEWLNFHLAKAEETLPFDYEET